MKIKSVGGRCLIKVSTPVALLRYQPSEFKVFHRRFALIVAWFKTLLKQCLSSAYLTFGLLDGPEPSIDKVIMLALSSAQISVARSTENLFK